MPRPRERLHRISIYVTKEQLAFLNETGNRSAYMRFLVFRDMRGFEIAQVEGTQTVIIGKNQRSKAIQLCRREQKKTVAMMTPEFGSELKNALKSRK